MACHFFTFPSSSPYRMCYVEVVIPAEPEDELDRRDHVNTTRAVMRAAHGNRWSMEHHDEVSFRQQADARGLRCLATIVLNDSGQWTAADTLGDG